MRTKLTAALLGAVLTVGGAMAGPAPAPVPRILVIDQSIILRGSLVGQSILKQLQSQATAQEASLNSRAQALRAEQGQLEQQLAIVSPAIRAAKSKAFEAKKAALQADAQKLQGRYQTGMINAQKQVEGALEPILRAIMAQRGANILLDRNAFVLATDNSFDITPQVIQMLNQRLPTVKAQLADPPAGAAPRQ